MKNTFLLFFIALFPFISKAIIIDDVRIMQAEGNNYPAVVYLSLENDSDNLEYLVGVEVIDHPESKAIISKTVIEKNVARIIKIDRLAIPDYSKISLDPIGIYIVIHNLDSSSPIDLKFTFKNAGEVIVNSKIKNYRPIS
ncbi:MAG: copper chaperone PCu(A)C [Rickettsiales bacterium]|jgi:copper(I)-binding protein|nr:copper chaperone PCu(A)C [Rickettsiales bacterium]